MTRLLALLLFLPTLLSACSKGDPRPNVLLVTFDTTRADHVSAYGYSKRTTPKLDELAADGERFTNAYAVTSWTLPAHGSIFTGKFPTSHGAQYDENGAINLVQEGGIKGEAAWSAYRANPFAAAEITLAHQLTDAGYATEAIVGGPWMKKVFGLGRGFEIYDDSNFQMDQGGSELNGRTAEDITDHAISFVDEHGDKPFFLFLNYYDPHGPYTPTPEYFKKYWKGQVPSPSVGGWPLLLAKYDAEIEYTDHHFGRLLDHLREQDLYANTLIIMTADHGELFGDQGGLRGHGDSLSQPEIHVPLLIKEASPQPPTGVNAELVQQVDLMPTILDRLGLPQVAGTQGHVIGKGSAAFALAEVNPLPFMNNQARDWRQIGDFKVYLEGDHKFIWGSRGRHQLFDLKADPGELNNLVERDKELAASMRAKLEKAFWELPLPGAVGEVEQPSAGEIDSLQQMGYAGGADEQEEQD